LPDYSKTTYESKIWIKQRNTSYKVKAPTKPKQVRYQLLTHRIKNKRAQTVNKKKAPAKPKGGRKQKHTAKDFCDFEVESEGGSRDEVDESGSDRYESDFICDDETHGVIEEGTYEVSEEEYFSNSDNASEPSDWSEESQERYGAMELAQNDGRNGLNKYRYCLDDDSYYLQWRFKIHCETFDKL